jgi:trypanothione synthetase/amidase
MSSRTNVPFGGLQGVCSGGVKAFSNGNDFFFSAERNFDEGLYTGFKWQCVEFARRWLLEKKGLVLPDVHWAAHIFSMTSVIDAVTGESVPMKAVANGGTDKPEADTLLIYPSSEGNMVGHVASIVEVGDGYIRVADQNHRFHKWEGNYSAELKVVFEDGKYTIQDRDSDNPDHVMIPLGWMTFPGVANRDPTQHLTLHPSLLTKEFDAPSLERVHYQPKSRPPAGWLDVNDEAEKVFMKKFDIDVSGNYEGEDDVTYYRMNIELWFKCIQASNQLHAMFVEATEKVLASDELLSRFALPTELWPRIRRSFKEQRAGLMGRFDLAWNGKEMKTYEYNADSAAVLMESAVIQEKWANSRGLGELNQRSGGWRIAESLERAWGLTGVKGRVHFCVDDEDEEKYTGLYCASIAKKVGVEPRLCVKFDEFSFREDGKIVDGEGVEVKAIWKTWNWDTAIQDYLKAREERGADFKPTTATKVRLCDLVLGDESIRVFEPFWKYIPANKAILPLVYDAHPDHPNLLKASYTLTEELKETGYAKKPIIGRVGRNITITSSTGSTLASSEGNYGDRDVVYQQLFELPSREGHFGILGGWIMGEQYAGTGVREDTVVITGSESPFSAVRIELPFSPTMVTKESLAEKKNE